MSRSSDAKSFMQRSGDAAEKLFRTYAEHHNINVERYGFDRTPLPHFHTLPQIVRSTPDYVATRQGGKEAFLVECKAGGNGTVVNIKKKDISPLGFWNSIGPLYLFFNDSKNKRVAFVQWDEIVQISIKHRDDITEGVWESDGVAFVSIPKRFFKWESYHEFGA